METKINVITGKITRSTLSIEEMNQREIDRQELAAEIARNDRNEKLSQSDWTQVSDVPVDQASWATYRQALRDIPEQEGFPENINWPTEP